MSVTRKLTESEVHLATQIFKDAVDYRKVKVHNRKYIFFQPANTAMTPNGEIYAPFARYSDDYSRGTPDKAALLIHELMHVWQYQNAILNIKLSAFSEFVRHRFNYHKAYYYVLSKDKDLIDYRLEQQATIVEDYYRVFALDEDFRMTFNGNYLVQNAPAERRELLKIVTSRFVSDPKYSGGR